MVGIGCIASGLSLHFTTIVGLWCVADSTLLHFATMVRVGRGERLIVAFCDYGEGTTYRFPFSGVVN
jgi:hypothetical protein